MTHSIEYWQSMIVVRQLTDQDLEAAQAGLDCIAEWYEIIEDPDENGRGGRTIAYVEDLEIANRIRDFEIKYRLTLAE